MMISSCADDDNDICLKKITTRVSQNPILHKNADQPKAEENQHTNNKRYRYNRTAHQ
jgi:hypothetical protein